MKKLELRQKRQTKIPSEKEIVQTISIRNTTPFDYIFNLQKEEDIIQIDFIQFSGGAAQYKSLFKLIEKQKCKINFHMSDFILKMSHGTLKVVKEIANMSGGNVDIFTNHVKFTLIKTETRYLIIDSTANADSDKKN